MGKPRIKELGPMPKAVRTGIVVLGLVFLGLTLVAGKFYLPNWRGDTVFLPVALLVAVLLVAAVLVQLFKKELAHPARVLHFSEIKLVNTTFMRPAFVNPPENQFGVRDGVRNGALPRRAGLASDLVEFPRRQDCCCEQDCVFPLIHLSPPAETGRITYHNSVL
jgi:hypothetical protein